MTSCWIFITISWYFIAVESQDVPHLAIHATSKDPRTIKEWNMANVLLRRDHSYPRMIWNAAFITYHRAVVQYTNVHIHAQCHTSVTKGKIKSVIFNYYVKNSAADQHQIFTANSQTCTDGAETKVNWPTINNVVLERTTVYFNSSIGAWMDLHMKLPVDMSGFLTCAIEVEEPKLTFHSNLLEIIDIKNDVAKFKGGSNLRSGFLHKNGVTKLQIAESGDKLASLRRVGTYVILGFTWGLSSETKINARDSSYHVVQNYWHEMVKNDKFGSYVIDRYGTLYLSMAHNTPSNVYGYITGATGDWSASGEQEKRYVITMTDNTGTFSNVHMSKESLNFINLDGPPLPARVIPVRRESDITVFMGNILDELECGFLTDSRRTYKPVWKINGTLINSERELISNYGIRFYFAQPFSLDLSGVKKSATGRWSCHLIRDDDVEMTELTAFFNLKVVEFPNFGWKYNSVHLGLYTSYDMVGRPPRSILLMDGYSMKVTCSISLGDGTGGGGGVRIPVLEINNVPVNELCTADSPGGNAALCAMKNNMQVTFSDKHFVYSVDKLQLVEASSSNSMAHLFSCSTKSKFPGGFGSYMVEDGNLWTKSYSAVNILPRPTPQDFSLLPKSKNETMAKYPTTFKCVLKDDYVRKIEAQGGVLKKFWKIGDIDQNSWPSLGNTSLLRQYVQFSADNNTLTIKPVKGAANIAHINQLSPVRCLLRIYYKGDVEDKEMVNLEVSGLGAPAHNMRQKRALGSARTYPEKGPLIYSTDLDPSAAHLRATFTLVDPQPEVVRTENGLFIVIGICSFIFLLILLLLLIIICRSRRNKGESYVIDQKERDQGRDPVRELREMTNFKEYQRKEEAPIKGSRWTLARSEFDVRSLDPNDSDAELGDDLSLMSGDRIGDAN